MLIAAGPAINQRLAVLNWSEIYASLNDFGYALTPPLLTASECESLINLYPGEEHFRSHVIMERYRFGRGDYKYFHYPLPEIVQGLRDPTYSYLAPIANQWNRTLGVKQQFPPNHKDFLATCKKQGQTRATPLLLHYQAGDFNCLHRDLYGKVAFPLQMTCFLSQPGADYEGGEFVLVEQQPRAQSKAEVIAPSQGQIVIFATQFRPAKGKRGFYKVSLKHGVSRIRRGVRFTLGIIYHDAE
jgi:hypothetical protein